MSLWIIAFSAFILILTGLKFVEILGVRQFAYASQAQNVVITQSSSAFVSRPLLLTCSSTSAGDMLKLALERLDGVNLGDDYDEWVRRVRQAERAALNALSCSPTNGHYWALFAMIRQSQVELTSEINTLLGLSQRFGPVELNAINARLSLSNRLSGQTLSEILPILNLDIGVICDRRYQWSKEILVRPDATLAQRIASGQPNHWCRQRGPEVTPHAGRVAIGQL